MREAEWRLSYPGTDFTFGTGATPVFNRTPPDLGDIEVRHEDAAHSHSDGVLMGRDFKGGRTVSFDLGIHGDPAAIRDTLGLLSAAWDAQTIRREPGAVAELHSHYRGKHRVAYGRPRRFAPIIADVATGLGAATAEFETVDPHFYSAEENTETVGLVAATGGGLLAPLASPLATTGTSDRSTSITVSSDLPVWPVLEFSGPITDPEIELLGLWKIRVRETLAYDQTLVIDTRPWRRRVYITPGAGSRRGALTRDSVRLINASIPAGTHEVAFRGRADTGSATVTIRWQNAYSTP